MSTVKATSPRVPTSHSRRKADPVKIISFITLLITTFLMLLPLFFMVSTSLKSKREMLKFPPTFLPESWAWSNYTEIFDTLQFGTLYKNSLIIAGLTVIGTLLLLGTGGLRLRQIQRPGQPALVRPAAEHDDAALSGDHDPAVRALLQNELDRHLPAACRACILRFRL